MKVHLVQLDSVWEDPRASYAQVERLLAATPPEAGALVVMPEMFATGFSLDLTKTCAGAALEAEAFLAGLARRYGVAVVGGITRPGAGGMGRNEALVLAPDGRVLARYLKQRPFSGGGEDLAHERGEVPALFEWDGVRVAPLVCYDLRFPEVFRAALRAGAEMFVVIAAWPTTRIEHWITLLRARAIENQAIVVGVNRTGEEPQHRYCGRSLVVDCHGQVLADAGEAEGVTACEIASSSAREWREQFPAVRDFLRWG
jgi:predicted amidohydrolase